MDTEHVSELLAMVISSVSVRGHVKLMTSLYACSQQSTSLLTKQAVRLGGRHNMPPPRDLSGGIIMDFNQNAENRCICHPEIQIYTNIFKFQTGVLCYNKEI